MIPATQRPDGTWRKARKIRTGFSSSSGGGTRYVPPAFRSDKVDGGCGKDSNAIQRRQARSLGEVAAGGVQSGSRRFLDAVLFLLATTAAPTPSETPEAEARGEQAEERGWRACGSVVGWPLGSAARAAKEQLGCDDCRKLSAEVSRPRDEAGGNPAAAAPASGDAAAVAVVGVSVVKTREEPSGESSDQCSDNHGIHTNGGTYTGRSDDARRTRSGETGSNSDGDWWARLRQTERGRTASKTCPEAGQGSNTESWVGLRLQLRASYVCSGDGQAAVVDFLKDQFGRQTATSAAEASATPGREEGQDEGQQKEEGGGARPAEETRPPRIAEPVKPTAPPAAGKEEQAHEVEREEGGGGPPSSSSSSTLKNSVAAAVLVFGPGLSKRDRAELHVQAEKAGGVASSSHGMGDGRFLSLSCGRGSREAAVEPELSSEQASLARQLFRLAQQEYHSRYERLSHREIREVVAGGGPNAQDHPELCRLFEKQQQQQQQHHQHDVGDSPEKLGNKAAAGKEEEPASSSQRQERTEKTVVAAGEEDPAEPVVPLEKCPW